MMRTPTTRYGLRNNPESQQHVQLDGNQAIPVISTGGAAAIDPSVSGQRLSPQGDEVSQDPANLHMSNMNQGPHLATGVTEASTIHGAGPPHSTPQVPQPGSHLQGNLLGDLRADMSQSSYVAGQAEAHAFQNLTGQNAAATQENQTGFFTCRRGGCTRTFHTYQALFEHTERFHSDRAHSCGSCNQAFRTYEELDVHYNATHRQNSNGTSGPVSTQEGAGGTNARANLLQDTIRQAAGTSQGPTSVQGGTAAGQAGLDSGVNSARSYQGQGLTGQAPGGAGATQHRTDSHYGAANQNIRSSAQPVFAQRRLQESLSRASSVNANQEVESIIGPSVNQNNSAALNAMQMGGITSTPTIDRQGALAYIEGLNSKISQNLLQHTQLIDGDGRLSRVGFDTTIRRLDLVEPEAQLLRPLHLLMEKLFRLIESKWWRGDLYEDKMMQILEKWSVVEMTNSPTLNPNAQTPGAQQTLDSQQNPQASAPTHFDIDAIAHRVSALILEQSSQQRTPQTIQSTPHVTQGLMRDQSSVISTQAGSSSSAPVQGGHQPGASLRTNTETTQSDSRGSIQNHIYQPNARISGATSTSQGVSNAETTSQTLGNQGTSTSTGQVPGARNSGQRPGLNQTYTLPPRDGNDRIFPTGGYVPPPPGPGRRVTFGGPQTTMQSTGTTTSAGASSQSGSTGQSTRAPPTSHQSQNRQHDNLNSHGSFQGGVQPNQEAGSFNSSHNGTQMAGHGNNWNTSMAAATANSIHTIMSSETWPPSWEYIPANAMMMKVQDVQGQAAALKFDGDVTHYSQFKDYFRSHVHHNNMLNISQKSFMLQIILKEDIRDRIGARTVNEPSKYKRMLKKLEELYGCNLEAGYMRKCHDLPMLDPSRPETLDKIAKVVSAAEGDFGEVYKPSLINIIIGKLTDSLAQVYCHRYKESERNFDNLSEYLNAEFKRVKTGVFYPQHYRQKPMRMLNQTSQVLTQMSDYNEDNEGETPEDYDCGEHYAFVNEQDRTKWKAEWPLCPVHKTQHFLNDCPSWHDGSLDYEARVKLVRESGRCWRCLAPTHRIENCKRKDKCQVGGCKFPDQHNTRLHKFESVVQAVHFIGASLKRQDDAESHLPRSERTVTLKYTVLKLTNIQTGNSVLVNTALDIGANLTLVHSGVIEKLGLEGPWRTLKATGIHGLEHIAETMLSPINIQSLNGKVNITAPMRFNDKPLGDIPMKDWRNYLEEHPEFESLDLPVPVQVPHGEPQIQMAVGNDFPIINQMLDLDSPGAAQIGSGEYMRPLAQRMMVGWCISGYTGRAPPTEQDILAGTSFFSDANYIFARKSETIKGLCLKMACVGGIRDSTSQETGPAEGRLPSIIEVAEDQMDINANFMIQDKNLEATRSIHGEESVDQIGVPDMEGVVSEDSPESGGLRPLLGSDQVAELGTSQGAGLSLPLTPRSAPAPFLGSTLGEVESVDTPLGGPGPPWGPDQGATFLPLHGGARPSLETEGAPYPPRDNLTMTGNSESMDTSQSMDDLLNSQLIFDDNQALDDAILMAGSIGHELNDIQRSLERLSSSSSDLTSSDTTTSGSWENEITDSEEDEDVEQILDHYALLTKETSGANREIQKLIEIDRIEGDDISETFDTIRCREIFKETFVQTESGRGRVAVCWKPGEPDLPENFEANMRRHLRTESRMIRNNPSKHEKDFLDQETLKLLSAGYVRELENTEENRRGSFWIPAFVVSQERKTTTPHRFIMNAAAVFMHKGNRKSMNDGILTPPNNLQELLQVLTRGRRFPVLLAGDIAKMFLQVLCTPEDARYMRFVWREGVSQNNPIRLFEWTCHFFGKSDSPFLAIEAVLQAAEQNKLTHPLAYESMTRSVLVDDLFDSVQTPELALSIMQETKDVLKKELAMNMRKWITSSKIVNAQIAEEEKAPKIEIKGVESGDHYSGRTLGLVYVALTDTFTFSIELDPPAKWTKRAMLSLLSRPYDPAGFTAPWTLTGRILFQQANQKHPDKDWDDELPSSEMKKFEKWLANAEKLNTISIARCLTRHPDEDPGLHQVPWFEPHQMCSGNHGEGEVGSEEVCLCRVWNFSYLKNDMVKEETPTDRSCQEINDAASQTFQFLPTEIEYATQCALEAVLVDHSDTDFGVQLGESANDDFDRCIMLSREVPPEQRYQVLSREFHIFTDASSYGYGAVAYQKTEYAQGDPTVRLIIAKGRVAPAGLTIPRLEMLGALLGAELAKKVVDMLELPSAVPEGGEAFHFWCDSTVVLFWLKTERPLRMWVQNRKNKILQITQSNQWRHCPGQWNCADIVSRGLLEVDELLEEHMWFHCARFIYLSKELWPADITQLGPPTEAAEKECRPVTGAAIFLVRATVLDQDHVQRFQNLLSYLKFLRVSETLKMNILQHWEDRESYHESKEQRSRLKRRVKRELDKSKEIRMQNNKQLKTYYKAVSKEQKVLPDLELEPEGLALDIKFHINLAEARVLLIKAIQKEGFGAEIELLKKDQLVNRKSVLYKLSPMLDQDGVLRVKGRFPPEQVMNHLTVLPAKSHGTYLLVKDIHESSQGHIGSVVWNCHAVRKTYWVPNLQSLVRKILKSCYDCNRKFPEWFKQEMAPLHMTRMPEPGQSPYAFAESVSVDFAGPWLTSQGRGKAKAKRWLSIFACAQTRAVHLELVPSMTTADCLLAFMKFFHRRGYPKHVVSDNGSNLTRTEKELQAIYDCLPKVARKLEESTLDLPRIEWTFTGARTPHQNGGVERMVGIAKRSLLKVCQDNPKLGSMRDFDLDALFIRVEDVMNSRPLTSAGSQDDAEQPLTPGHFIRGNGNASPLRLSIPEDKRPSMRNEFNRRWIFIEEMVTMFWKRMTTEFLESQRKRSKWMKGDIQLEAGAVVILMDEFNERLRWPLAVVLEVQRDSAGKIQTVLVLYKGHETRRGIRSLAPLPTFEEQ